MFGSRDCHQPPKQTIVPLCPIYSTKRPEGKVGGREGEKEENRIYRKKKKIGGEGAGVKRKEGRRENIR